MKNSKRDGKRKRKSAKGAAAKPPASSYWEPDLPWEPKVPLSTAVPAEMKHPAEVREAISTFLQLDELGLQARRTPDGTAFGIYDGDHRVGTVSESRAIVGTHSRPADFTGPSAPWADVQGYLAERVEKSAPAPHRQAPPVVYADPRLIYAWPETAGPVAMSVGVEASRPVRTERVHDHDVPVALQTVSASLVIEPIAEGGMLAFRYTDQRGQTVTAALMLRSAGNLIPVLVDGSVEDGLLASAWLAALSAFADLACRPRLASARTRRMWASRHLAPRSASAEHMAAAVSGHVRRLPEGHRPRQGPKERAASIGVQLAESETWVRPHPRGGQPPAGEILFDWCPSAAVAEQLRLLAHRTDDAHQSAA